MAYLATRSLSKNEDTTTTKSEELCIPIVVSKSSTLGVLYRSLIRKYQLGTMRSLLNNTQSKGRNKCNFDYAKSIGHPQLPHTVGEEDFQKRTENCILVATNDFQHLVKQYAAARTGGSSSVRLCPRLHLRASKLSISSFKNLFSFNDLVGGTYQGMLAKRRQRIS